MVGSLVVKKHLSVSKYQQIITYYIIMFIRKIGEVGSETIFLLILYLCPKPKNFQSHLEKNFLKHFFGKLLIFHIALF